MTQNEAIRMALKRLSNSRQGVPYVGPEGVINEWSDTVLCIEAAQKYLALLDPPKDMPDIKGVRGAAAAGDEDLGDILPALKMYSAACDLPSDKDDRRGTAVATIQDYSCYIGFRAGWNAALEDGKLLPIERKPTPAVFKNAIRTLSAPADRAEIMAAVRDFAFEIKFQDKCGQGNCATRTLLEKHATIISMAEKEGEE